MILYFEPREITMKPDRNSYTSLDFAGWKATDGLVIAPKFQRRGVWSSAKRSYLIDTIIRGLPIPPIYIRQRQSDDKTKTVREIIDGQQRISAVLDFLDGRYALSKSLNGAHAGKRFSQLAESDQDSIRDYSLNCETFVGLGDEAVLEIFARMNTYSVQLNAQELRNGRFFGRFKQTVYDLALEHNAFWLMHGIITDAGIARMSEAELVSELLIAQIDGQQDKKKSITDFYETYDDSFPDAKLHADRFRKVIDEIQLTFESELRNLEWRRRPMFYTLYCVVYDRIFGLPAKGGPRSGRTRKFSEDDRTKLFDAAVQLSEVLVQSKEAGGKGGEKYSQFVTASQRQTDNIGPRRSRFATLAKVAFGD